MASPVHVTTRIANGLDKAVWSALGVNSSADSGNALLVPGLSDVTIQVLGTFANATVTMQGSNDGGTTWATLRDYFGADLTFTAAGLKGLAEVAAHIRPTITAGSSSDLDVYAVIRRG